MKTKCQVRNKMIGDRDESLVGVWVVWGSQARGNWNWPPKPLAFVRGALGEVADWAITNHWYKIREGVNAGRIVEYKEPDVIDLSGES